MSTTGERAETRAEVDCLRMKGCTEAQGYFFSKPRPASEVFAMLEERKAALSTVACNSLNTVRPAVARCPVSTLSLD
jgi:predicted signal transduction protein with EAL and GGDEF domain